MKTIISLLLLAVVNLIHCQVHEQMIVFTLQGVLQKLEDISDTLKGYENIQQKQDEIMDTLRGHEELLQRIPDVQEKLQHLENNVQGVQEKIEHLEKNLQGLHHELEHVKGLSQETGQCLRRDDLEHLSNISATAQQEIKSFVHEEISGVISLAEKDECSEGSLPCGDKGSCENTVFSFTCSCPPGFTWDGSDCADIDECIQGSAKCDSNAKCTNTLGSYSCSCNPHFEGDGRTCSCPSEGFASNGDICEDIDECSSAEGKDVCVPNAVCKNSIGSYSCSCIKPFEGDGRTSCEFRCRSPAKFISGLGCVKQVRINKSYHDMNGFCQDEGGRLLTVLNREQLKDVGNTFSSHGGWVGVYDGKWTSDEESLVPEDLWAGGQGYRPDTSERCGVVWWDSSLKLFQEDCSDKIWGFCQFHQQQLP